MVLSQKYIGFQEVYPTMLKATKRSHQDEDFFLNIKESTLHLFNVQAISDLFTWRSVQ